jgi:hypothetical protein
MSGKPSGLGEFGKSFRSVAQMRAPKLPTGAWPAEMRAETAAAYCDEPSIEAFMAKVSRGVYSQPTRERGCLPKWHRRKLDHDIAHRHGLRVEAPPLAEDVTDLI